MTQQYTSAYALEWMDNGLCPECGFDPELHTGAGGPDGCSLTDNGAAQRVHDRRKQVAEAEARYCSKGTAVWPLHRIKGTDCSQCGQSMSDIKGEVVAR